jgi:hypothetical protein
VHGSRSSAKNFMGPLEKLPSAFIPVRSVIQITDGIRVEVCSDP